MLGESMQKIVKEQYGQPDFDSISVAWDGMQVEVVIYIYVL